MLEPREADIPALFLVLVVLPLVTYILLGKWNESAKKKERISLLAQLAAEEDLRVEAMATASVIPTLPSSKVGFHECARCFSPAITRCSRCKSVRYCSGKCQILHWRQGHRQDCYQLGAPGSNSSPKPVSIEDSVDQRTLLNENLNKLFYGYEIKQQEITSPDKPNHAPINTAIASTTTTTTAVNASEVSLLEGKLLDKQVSSRSKRECSRREDVASHGSSQEAYNSRVTDPTLPNIISLKEISLRHKLGNDDLVVSSEEPSWKHHANSPVVIHGRSVPRSTNHESHKLRGENGCIFQTGIDSPISNSLEKNRTNLGETEKGFTLNNDNFLREGLTSNDEASYLNSSPEIISVKSSRKLKGILHPLEPKSSSSPKSALKLERENACSGVGRKGNTANESKIHQVNALMDIRAQSSNGVSDTGIMKMMGLKKSPKVSRQGVTGATRDTHKRNKVLFPYEEFVKFFQCEIWDLYPRGLLNCGNSCYANAVLQCLTCTKPLIVYLLQKYHSRTCFVKDWCLMCELEQHVMMLGEAGGPLSPNRILLHMRNIGSQMGGGSQEDAHEFLRLLVTSMQSICLEAVGGEKHVDSRLQETTFIQHTFGGSLRSKVKCLRCHHESERYENIMDLTLEILGWVESLEDALAQFTAAEDLDGENMYRCGRCATYVKARKQLSIHEAPNILTIVLKRFQTGKYGKINKCITFPDMLDMIPFMTGIGDSPPLYLLYAVVVHLDTLNASFSGHYVAYVKDLQGIWLRIDDTEVQPVPMSQVMSEGAYILFYSSSKVRNREVAMATHLFKRLSLLFGLLSSIGPWSENHDSVGIFPPTCSRIECPSFDVVHVGNGFEVRRYNSTVWMSTSPIQDISLVDATRTGFLQLFDYIQGKNDYDEKIEMTAPVITQVSPSDGPFCESSFVVSFYVPRVNQADPPPAKGLHSQKWGPVHAAVRQFSGFVTDENVGEEAAALQASLAGTSWSSAVEKGRADPTSVYTVAQYNSPFEFQNRVNEIWMMFDMEDDSAAM